MHHSLCGELLIDSFQLTCVSNWVVLSNWHHFAWPEEQAEDMAEKAAKSSKAAKKTRKKTTAKSSKLQVLHPPLPAAAEALSARLPSECLDSRGDTNDAGAVRPAENKETATTSAVEAEGIKKQADGATAAAAAAATKLPGQAEPDAWEVCPITKVRHV